MEVDGAYSFYSAVKSCGEMTCVFQQVFLLVWLMDPEAVGDAVPQLHLCLVREHGPDFLVPCRGLLSSYGVSA